MPIRHDITRLALALRSAGLDVFPHSPDAPYQVNVAGFEGLYRLSPVGFQPEGQPDHVWLAVEQVEAICGAFCDLTGIVDRYATQPEAETLWALLARAAGDRVHFTGHQNPDCLCPGCHSARLQLAWRAELANGARPSVRTMDTGHYGTVRSC